MKVRTKEGREISMTYRMGFYCLQSVSTIPITRAPLLARSRILALPAAILCIYSELYNDSSQLLQDIATSGEILEYQYHIQRVCHDRLSMDLVTTLVKSSFSWKDLISSTGSATKASISVILVLLYGYLSRKYKFLSKEAEDVSSRNQTAEEPWMSC